MRLVINGRVKSRSAVAGVQTSYALDFRQEFLSLYPNRAKHIYKEPGDPKWKTSQIPLFTGMIDAAISASCSTFYGAFFGKTASFAVLDIDEGSQYHNAVELEKLLDELLSVGLSAVPYRSSESGGWHLYLPFIQAEQSDEVEATLKRWLRTVGYEIRGGQLEVFPTGNALRLPLQPGFAWLDESGNLIHKREDLGVEQALAFFLQDRAENARDWQEAKGLIESQILLAEQARGSQFEKRVQRHEERIEIRGFEHLFARGCIRTVWENGRKFWQDGLQKPGDRHNAVLAVGHYLWYGDPERGVQAVAGGRYDRYRARLIEEWLAQKHNGMCRHINEGNWRIVREQIERAVSWRKDKEQERPAYPLTSRLLKRLVSIYKRTGRVWAIEQFERANENSKLEARDRIRQAILELKQEGQLLTFAEIARRAGAHWRTVKKNEDLLVLGSTLEGKEVETQTNLDLLARSAIENNLGGRCPLSPCLESSDELSHEQKSREQLGSVQEQSSTSFVSEVNAESQALVEPGGFSPENVDEKPRLSLITASVLEESDQFLVIIGNFFSSTQDKPRPVSQQCRKLIYRVLIDAGGNPSTIIFLLRAVSGGNFTTTRPFRAESASCFQSKDR